MACHVDTLRRPLSHRGVLFVLLICMIGAGCASTPQASRDRDAQAKTFDTHPATAAIYVYRNDNAPEEESVLFVDGRLIGATLPRTYFRFNVRPGTHRLHGIGADTGNLVFEAHAGDIVFISLRVLTEYRTFNRSAMRQAAKAYVPAAPCWRTGRPDSGP
jgi:hypothetical protein